MKTNVIRAATIKTDELSISNSYCEKLFGVEIDSQLKFNNHFETKVKKATCFS